MADIERRSFTLDTIKVVRAAGAAPKITGHAAVFNALSEDMGGFREKIAPGAFRDAIPRDDVRALFNHDPNYVLGRNRSGTLKLAEDATGLAIEIDPPDTQYARDLAVSMERGDITQMSFGFTCDKGGQMWDEQPDGSMIRTLRSVSLFDVSPVTFPAYPQTDVAMRSLKEFNDSKAVVLPEGVPLSVLDCELAIAEKSCR